MNFQYIFSPGDGIVRWLILFFLWILSNVQTYHWYVWYIYWIIFLNKVIILIAFLMEILISYFQIALMIRCLKLFFYFIITTHSMQ